MPRPIHNSVIVITGASSGIGRATAREFAKQRATLLLAARNETALQEVAQECQRLGATAVAMPTDVTNESAVQALAQRAIASFGRIDVWVNNAAVSLFARFEEAPPSAFRQVIETNLFGYIYGARAALPYFREQGSGNLINVSSVVGVTGQAYTSPYTISKYAIRGLSDSLRMELYLDNAREIHVCTVLPGSIDTPIFQHAANYTNRQIKAMNPVYPAKQVADAIVGLVDKPEREIVVGQTVYLQLLQKTLAPDLFEPMLAKQVDQDHFQDHKPTPQTDGNLFEPMHDYTGISGNWLGTGGITTQDVWDMARETAQKIGLPLS
ncbi:MULTISPECIES: SDR family oxidoreductase [unclassified Nodularia (in: cyanobacteria)]|uniref:SDR family oxidoreductase n=1 Tax=unclassified Nodularia (in: cyanobacteria) TaxID=2656917 RepID=UPI001881C93F|nr:MULTISPECIES: SDR family oxidoreductase [unclassified Nodularia (in: cyanobacteria)]MBE9198680.1 SDR family oxidoreductase [Nodularia sp. LEGE 06071]MCC2691750.1 SDR family oxidoreductase [Nodularia sp. LEGE 04288]